MLQQARTIGDQLKLLGFSLRNTGYKSWKYVKGNVQINVNYNAWQYSEPFSVEIVGQMSLINPSVDEFLDALI